MRKVGAVVAVSVLSLAATFGADPESPRSDFRVPADFKLVIRMYGLGKEPLEKADLVVLKGRAYHFVTEPTLEIIVHDPVSSTLELVDLKRKIRAEVTSRKLETFRANLRDAIAAVCAKKEAEGGRANRVAAAMSRDLIEPRLKAAYDERTHQLRLTNPTLEIDARGEPEEDPARLAMIASTLTALIGLEALRDPQGIPPFARLDAVRALTGDHRLRPTELTFLYRLYGPPKKRRWTYHLVPSLTAREVEAISRIELLRERCAPTKFERYDRPGAP